MTLNIRALKKSKIKYLLVFILVLSMIFPSAVFAATVVAAPGDSPILTPDITTSTTGKVTVTITFPSGVTIPSKQFSLDGGVTWMDYTGPVAITDNTTMKAMYTYLNGEDTYCSKVGSLTISNITGGTSSDANNGNWAVKNIQKNYTPEADAMVRVGDIDNFGLLFAKGYDPFSGLSTKTHSYPWSRPTGEPDGLDTIMEVSGYNYSNSSGSDGYTNTYNNNTCVRVKPVTMNYDLTGINVTSAKLQLFVDDLQAGIQADNAANSYYRAKDVAYVATINGVEITELSSYINQLNQSGPIGKLITFNLPTSCLQLIKTGNISIKIDDPNPSKWGDGFAIDFIKLLINPKVSSTTSSISGTVTDKNTGVALSGAKVTACGLSTITDSKGNYTLPRLDAGLAVVQASNTGYISGSITKDILRSQTYTGVNLQLEATPKLGLPIISEDILTPTTSTGVTIVYPDNPEQKFYSISKSNGTDVWVSYTGTFKVYSNCTVKAYSASTGKTNSDIATYNVTNIIPDGLIQYDKDITKPAKSITATVVNITQSATVSIENPHTFTTNNSQYTFTLTARDSFGNTTTNTKTTAVMTKIDNTSPQGSFGYVRHDTGKLTLTLHVTDSATNGDYVSATNKILLTDELGNILKDAAGNDKGADGSNVLVEASKDYTFYFVDEAGNRGSAVYSVYSTQLQR